VCFDITLPLIDSSLSDEKVKASPSEFNAIIRGFMECFYYVIGQNLSEASLVDVLVHEQVGYLLIPEYFLLYSHMNITVVVLLTYNIMRDEK
jgi:hypothetical protein